MRFEVRSSIVRARAEVWAVLCDREALPRWQPNLRTMTPLGPAGLVGSRTRLVYAEMGQTLDVVETIEAWEAPTRFAARYDARGGTCLMDSLLEDEPGGAATAWTLRVELTLKGLFKLAEPMVRGMFEQRMRENIDRFRALVEGSPGASGV